MPQSMPLRGRPVLKICAVVDLERADRPAWEVAVDLIPQEPRVSLLFQLNQELFLVFCKSRTPPAPAAGRCDRRRPGRSVRCRRSGIPGTGVQSWKFDSDHLLRSHEISFEEALDEPPLPCHSARRGCCRRGGRITRVGRIKFRSTSPPESLTDT